MVSIVLTEDPANFCRKIQRVIDTDVYRNSTGDRGSGQCAGKRLGVALPGDARDVVIGGQSRFGVNGVLCMGLAASTYSR